MTDDIDYYRGDGEHGNDGSELVSFSAQRMDAQSGKYCYNEHS